MAKYIDSDALISDIKQMRNTPNGYSDTFDKSEIIGVIEEQPAAADVRPNLNGKWVRRRYIAGSGKKIDMVYCIECGEEYSYDAETGVSAEDYNFCPNCGADMRGEK